MTEAMSWVPGATEPAIQAVAAATDVAALAEALLGAYRQAGDTLPGIELHADGSDDGTGLSIAIGPAGWAIIHTGDDYTQYRTVGDPGADGSVEVRWEEPTTIPASWFVPAGTAVTAVERWLADGQLDPALTWSGDTA